MALVKNQCANGGLSIFIWYIYIYPWFNRSDTCNSYSRALLLLRKKKYQEQVLTRVDGQLENVERMIHDLEFAQVEVKVVDGLKMGNDALKQLHALLSIDSIEKVMDETREGIEKQREIDEVLSSTVIADVEIDESEIEAELDALMEAEVVEKAPEIPIDILPEVPKDLPERDKDEIRTKEKIQEPVALTAWDFQALTKTFVDVRLRAIAYACIYVQWVRFAIQI